MTDMRTGTVTSKRDGTTIGFRRIGNGPGLVVLHGAMEWSLSHAQLAEALADNFTVYLPDRRGRGLSGPAGDDHSMASEVEDLEALLSATGSQFVLGVSSGALVALFAGLQLPAIRKVGIFEPPLFPDAREPAAILDRFDRELSNGNLAGALVEGMKGARMGPGFLRALPSRLLAPLTAAAMRQDDKRASERYIPMRSVAPTLHNDFSLALEASGPAERFAGIAAQVLLLGGAKSPAYLKNALDALAKALPDADRVEFPGLGHGATGNTDRGGRPDVVAGRLRAFFADDDARAA